MAENPNFGLSNQECERLQKGDHRLQSKVFDKHALSFVRMAKDKWGVSVEDAEDIVSSAFAKLFCKMQSVDFQSDNLSGYVYKIIERASWDCVEKQKRSIVETKEILPDIIEHETDNAFLEQLNKAFNRLGDKCQKLLSGFYWDDKDHSEMAEILGISEDASRQRKRECMKKLREIMRADEVLGLRPI
jgi:RNA polymerase sigma factor (sigma-70 family)